MGKKLIFGNVVIFLSLIFFVYSSTVSASSKDWTINEASILLPIPSKSDLAEAIPLKSILTKNQFASAVGQAISDDSNPNAPIIMSGNISGNMPVGKNDFDSLYLVSIRVDPCFKFNFKDSCQKQIRLVWQPMEFSGDHVQTVDGAVHTFYNLSDDEFSNFLSQLAKLDHPYEKLLQSVTNLQVNPILARYGYKSEYFKNFKALLFSTVRKSYFSRMAMMELHSRGEFWDFFAIDFDRAGNFARANIPNFSAPTLEFSNLMQQPEVVVSFILNNHFGGEDNTVAARKALFGQNGFLGSFGPGGGTELSPIDDIFQKSNIFFASPIIQFLGDSRNYPKKNLVELSKQIDEVNNQEIHLPGTIDCVSCHAAQPISSLLDGAVNSEIKSFHAFGYFKDQVSVAKRTRIEALATIKILNNK